VTTDADGKTVVRGTGKRTVATAYALDAVLAHHKRRFGRPPEQLEGILGFKNLENFQRQYLKATELGLDHEAATQAAIRSISFGIHRIDRGYGDFEVECGPLRNVWLENGEVLAQVPESVYVIARPTQGVRSPHPGIDDSPAGAYGPSSEREFDPEQAGGTVRALDWRRVRITTRGIDVVEQHLVRFGPVVENQRMIARLRQIASGDLAATDYDLRFYTHELREYVRYRRLGHATGAGDDGDLWNNAHTATLEDYGLHEHDAERRSTLYHPDVLQP
jgi:hypothetical protein